MKKFRFSAMAIFAIVIALASSAFTMKDKAAHARSTENTYEFRGTYSLANVKTESNYYWVGSPTGCGGADIICAVTLPGDTGENAHPDAFNTPTLEALEDAYNKDGQAGFIDMSPE